MHEAPKFFQYFMKKLEGKNPEMKKWGKKNYDQGSVYVFHFSWNIFSPIYKKSFPPPGVRGGGLFCKIYTPVFLLNDVYSVYLGP